MSQSATYAPNLEFVGKAHVQGMEGYRALYERAQQDPEGFWEELAEREMDWFQKWDPFSTGPILRSRNGLPGAKTNVAYNCLDRHLTGARRKKAAIICEGEPGDQRTITYEELHRLVCRFANVLKGSRFEGRRSLDHLHADDSRGGHRDACLCPSRRDALRRLRRILGRGAEGSHSGSGRAGGHYGRWRMAARQGSAAEVRRG